MSAYYLGVLTQLRDQWMERTFGERLIVGVVMALVIGGLAGAFVYQAHQARAQLRISVTDLRAQAARLERQAREYEGLRTSPPPAASHSDLRTLVEAQAGAAGLTRALTRIESQDGNRVQVVFGGVSFAEWLAWVANMETLRVRTEACRIEALAAPGLASITATLSRNP